MAIRILLLADINSEHTQKWAIGLADSGYKIAIFSFTAPKSDWYHLYRIECLHQPVVSSGARKLWDKIGYIRFLPKLKEAIDLFAPHILHAHYASSYGLLGALSGFNPYIISVWGTDVMKFPYKNRFTRGIIKYNLSKADAVCATSYTLEKHIHRLTNKDVEVIPFGVNLDEFINKPSLKDRSAFTIGCIKSLEKNYNIGSVIVSFAKLKDKHPDKNLKLVIVGEGEERANLQHLVKELHIEEQVVFEGKLPHHLVADKLNELDVLVNISEYESFGVSVVEAMACQVPVIVSEAEGLKEVVYDQTNGSIVACNNIEEIVGALERLMLSETLREAIGLNALERVRKNYNWKHNLNKMMSVYDRILCL
jgi:glycosyltransferase involved in cell wall biosynthesis